MKEALKTIWYLLCRYIFVLIPDKQFVQFTAFVTFKRLGFRFKKYNLKNPVSFNEKLTYLKLNQANTSLACYADKLRVREFITRKIGNQYLIPLIKTYKDPEEINFDILPQSFVLKTNHGSGWNIICTDKNSINYEQVRRKLKKWLSYNSFYFSREYQYKEIEPVIICEKLLDFNIYDYKFFCFDGEPKIVQVDIDRFTDHRRAFYNMNWEKQDFSIRYPISEKEISKPEQLSEMQDICRKLSSQFKFVRVDLYIFKSQIYFGELTFFPGACNEPFNPVEADYSFGELLVI